MTELDAESASLLISHNPDSNEFEFGGETYVFKSEPSTAERRGVNLYWATRSGLWAHILVSSDSAGFDPSRIVAALKSRLMAGSCITDVRLVSKRRARKLANEFVTSLIETARYSGHLKQWLAIFDINGDINVERVDEELDRLEAVHRMRGGI